MLCAAPAPHTQNPSAIRAVGRVCWDCFLYAVRCARIILCISVPERKHPLKRLLFFSNFGYKHNLSKSHAKTSIGIKSVFIYAWIWGLCDTYEETAALRSVCASPAEMCTFVKTFFSVFCMRENMHSVCLWNAKKVDCPKAVKKGRQWSTICISFTLYACLVIHAADNSTLSAALCYFQPYRGCATIYTYIRSFHLCLISFCYFDIHLFLFIISLRRREGSIDGRQQYY